MASFAPWWQWVSVTVAAAANRWQGHGYTPAITKIAFCTLKARYLRGFRVRLDASTFEESSRCQVFGTLWKELRYTKLHDHRLARLSRTVACCWCLPKLHPLSVCPANHPWQPRGVILRAHDRTTYFNPDRARSPQGALFHFWALCFPNQRAMIYRRRLIFYSPPRHEHRTRSVTPLIASTQRPWHSLIPFR
ncbi:hypothetical protein BDW22DRAFT_1028656 [Trametopsis cervina]|nr:hypothetical protein BDW22DRAFT_1028656 [Trametopsis cervina]